MKVFKRIITFVFIILLYVGYFSVPTQETKEVETFAQDTITTRNIISIEDDWNLFINAIAWVESRHKEDVINESTNAVGYLQITPIYVREVNRILELKKSTMRYSLDDRFSKTKSIEMFHVHQQYHNPNYDKLKCLRQHLGTYSESYTKEVFSRYQHKLANYEIAYSIEK